MGKRSKKSKGKRAAWAWKDANPFYVSKEWIELRGKVLKHYGRQCMVCGATSKDGVQINVDHIKPRKFWPSLALDFDNMGVLCGYHNKLKGNKNWGDYREKGWVPPVDISRPVRKLKHKIKIEVTAYDLPESQREHLKSILG